MHPQAPAKPRARLAGLLLITALLCPAFSPAAMAEEPAATAHMIKQRVADLETAAAVTVCRRRVPPDNPFLAAGSFNC